MAFLLFYFFYACVCVCIYVHVYVFYLAKSCPCSVPVLKLILEVKNVIKFIYLLFEITWLFKLNLYFTIHIIIYNVLFCPFTTNVSYT